MGDPPSPTTCTVCNSGHAIQAWTDTHPDALAVSCPACQQLEWVAAITDSEWEAENIQEELGEEDRLREAGG